MDQADQKEAQEDKGLGDKIEIDHVRKGAAVAGGRGAIAAILNITIKGSHWLPVVGVLLAVVGVLTILYFQLRPAPACTPEMTGGFNVAVAQFLTVDGDENPIDDPNGLDLADFIRERITTNFAELNLESVVPYSIWGPECTGKIKGETFEERRQAAQARAEEINAHVIIYGMLKIDPELTTFSPEFLVNHASFKEADEISGNHEFGSSLLVTLPLKDSIQPLENRALAGRVTGLNQITVGLVYYSVDHFEKAIEYFKQAEENQDWIDLDGKEIVYLLLGNAHVRLAARDQSPTSLPAAAAYFQYPLDTFKKDYGRAMVGLACVRYLQALGQPSDLSVDPTGLAEAEQWLDKALSLEGQPESANIETKAHYYLGQINLARVEAQISGTDWLAIAQKEFEWVVQDYEGGDEYIVDYASNAYARLGLIASYQGNFTGAEGYLKKAISLATPYHQAQYYALLGNLYNQAGMTQAAVDAYEQAILVARSNSDQVHLSQYMEALAKIKSGE